MSTDSRDDKTGATPGECRALGLQASIKRTVGIGQCRIMPNTTSTPTTITEIRSGGECRGGKRTIRRKGLFGDNPAEPGLNWRDRVGDDKDDRAASRNPGCSPEQGFQRDAAGDQGERGTHPREEGPFVGERETRIRFRAVPCR